MTNKSYSDITSEINRGILNAAAKRPGRNGRVQRDGTERPQTGCLVRGA